MEQIANAGKDGGSGGFVAKGQSLYEVFLNRSYSCSVEALGNPMIQPLQYFELENVPMFYGSYLIRDVKHSIRPHSMKTTFTGDRIPYAVVPIVEDLVSTFKLKPSQSNATTSLKSSSSTGGGSTSATRSKFDISKLPSSEDTTVILENLQGVDVQEHREKNKYCDLPDGCFGNEMFNGINRKDKKFAENGTGDPTGIVLHWVGGWKFSSLMSGVRDDSWYAGYHYRIDWDGTLLQTGNLDLVSNHAGCKGTKGCFGLNGQGGSPGTIGISYEGGIESGWLRDDGSVATYIRTWEQWQEETLQVPFCPKGVKPNGGRPWVCDDSENANQRGGASAKQEYKPRAQWDSLVNAILLAKY